jgi:hypothetical protein
MKRNNKIRAKELSERKGRRMLGIKKKYKKVITK